MYRKLKERVLRANLRLPELGLVTFTWGNVSEIDRSLAAVAIKPSGVEYDVMEVDDIVVVDLQGKIIEGNLKPSSDLPTHLELYKSCADIGGIVHTHSPYATSFAQAGCDIAALGTTHADYFYGDVPCTRPLLYDEIQDSYEAETGRLIAETFKKRDIKVHEVPACLVCSHGPFCWGKDCETAVYHAVVLEEVAKMNLLTRTLSQQHRIPQALLDKHYLRKHGDNAYYGQGK